MYPTYIFLLGITATAWPLKDSTIMHAMIELNKQELYVCFVKGNIT